MNVLISVLGGNAPVSPTTGGLRLSTQKTPAESFGRIMDRVNARMSALNEGAGNGSQAVLDSPVRRSDPSRAPEKTSIPFRERTEMKGSSVESRGPSVSNGDSAEMAPPAGGPGKAVDPAKLLEAVPEEILAGTPVDDETLVRALDRVLSGAGLERLLNLLNELLSLEPEQGADLLVQASGGKVSREEALAFLKALQAFMGAEGRQTVVQQLLSTDPKAVAPPVQGEENLVKNAQAQALPVEAPPPAATPKPDASPLAEGMKAAPDAKSVPRDLSAAQVTLPAETPETVASDARTVRDLLLLLSESKAGRVVLEVAAPPSGMQGSAQGSAPVLAATKASELPVPPRLEAVLNLLAPKGEALAPPVKPPLEMIPSAVQAPLKLEVPVDPAVLGPKVLPELAILKAPAPPVLQQGAALSEADLSIAKLVHATLNPAQSDLAAQKSFDWSAFAQTLTKETASFQKPVILPLGPALQDLAVPGKPGMVPTVPVTDALTGKGLPQQALPVDALVLDPLAAGTKGAVENSRNMPILDSRAPDLAKPVVRAEGVEIANTANGVKPNEAAAVRAAVKSEAKLGVGIDAGETLNRNVDIAWAKTGSAMASGTLSLTPQSAARGVVSTSAANMTNSSDIIQQISNHVGSQLMKTHTLSKMSFQLIPESLGRVTIQVAVVDQTVTARIVVGSPDVRDALQHHMVELRTSLNQAGLQIDNLQVHVQAGSNGQGLAQYFEYQHEGFASDVKWAPEVPPAETPEVPASDVALAWGRMNLVNVLV